METKNYLTPEIFEIAVNGKIIDELGMQVDPFVSDVLVEYCHDHIVTSGTIATIVIRTQLLPTILCPETRIHVDRREILLTTNQKSRHQLPHHTDPILVVA